MATPMTLTKGQEAFKRLAECLLFSYQYAWVESHEFTIKTMLNTFNTRYCSCLNIYKDGDFDSIFLHIGDVDYRVDSLYMKVDPIGQKYNFFMSLCRGGAKKAGTRIEVSIDDERIITKDYKLVDTIFNTPSDLSEFASNTTVEKLSTNGNKSIYYTLDRGEDVPPFVILENNRKDMMDTNGDLVAESIEDDSRLFDTLGTVAYLRDNIIPQGDVTRHSTASGAISSSDKDTLDVRQRQMLMHFLFGPGDIDYFDSNIHFDKDENSHTFNDKLSRLPWDNTIKSKLVNLIESERGKILYDYIPVDYSNTEKLFPEYGTQGGGTSTPKLSTPKAVNKSTVNTTGDQPAGNNAKPGGTDSDDGNTGKQPAGGNNAKPGDAKQQIPNNTSPSKIDPNFTQLMKFNQLLKAITPTQFDTKYLAIVKLLNMFNYVHCSEVSPDESHRIQPIFVEFEGNSYRVCRVYILNYNQFLYECRTVDNTFKLFSVKTLGKLPQGAPFTAKSQPDPTVSFIYKPIDPIFGEVHYRYLPAYLKSNSPVVTCIDTNGLYSYTDKTRWYVDTRYAYNYTFSDTVIAYMASYGGNKDRFKIDVPVAKFDRSRDLSTFLFDSGFPTALGNIISGQTQWINLIIGTGIDSTQSTLDELKKVSPSIYNALSLPETPIFPLPDPIQQGGDIQALIGQVPRAKLLYKALGDLEESVAAKTKRLSYREGKYEILNEEFVGKFNLSLNLLGEFAQVLDAQDSQYGDKYEAFEVEYDKYNTETIKKTTALKTKLGVSEKEAVEYDRRQTDVIKSAVFITSGMDIMTNKESYSEMIRSNVFKGKYNAELIVSDNHGNEHLFAEFKHINTYTDENNRLVYGAMCSKNSQQVFHNETGNKMTLDNGTIRINVKDEKGRVIRTIDTSFSDTPKDSYLCMLRATGTRLFLTRPTESDALKLKMFVIDV